MADLQNKISFDTAGAVANVKALSSAIKEYNSSVRSVVAGAPKGQQKAAKGFAQTAKVTDKAAASVKNLGKETVISGKKMEKAAGQAILTWKSVARIGVMQVAHQAVSKLTSTFSNAVTAAREYGKQLAEV